MGRPRTRRGLPLAARRSWPDTAGHHAWSWRTPDAVSHRRRVRIGLVLPGFSAEPGDWCIPALRHLVDRLAEQDDVRVISLRYPYRRARYGIGRAEVIALGGGQRRGLASLEVLRQGFRTLVAEHRRRP